MELDPQVADYVVNFHAHLMTETERKAQRHLFATMKATMGRSDETAQREVQNHKMRSRMLSNEPNVLSLAKEVISSFNSQQWLVFLEILLIRCFSITALFAGN